MEAATKAFLMNVSAMAISHTEEAWKKEGQQDEAQEHVPLQAQTDIPHIHIEPDRLYLKLQHSVEGGDGENNGGSSAMIVAQYDTYIKNHHYCYSDSDAESFATASSFCLDNGECCPDDPGLVPVDPCILTSTAHEGDDLLLSHHIDNTSHNTVVDKCASDGTQQIATTRALADMARLDPTLPHHHHHHHRLHLRKSTPRRQASASASAFLIDEKDEKEGADQDQVHKDTIDPEPNRGNTSTACEVIVDHLTQASGLKSWALRPLLEEVATRASTPFISHWVPSVATNTTTTTTTTTTTNIAIDYAALTTDVAGLKNATLVDDSMPTVLLHGSDIAADNAPLPLSELQQQQQYSGQVPSDFWSLFAVQLLRSPYQAASFVSSLRDSTLASSDASLLSRRSSLCSSAIEEGTNTEDQYNCHHHQHHWHPDFGFHSTAARLHLSQTAAMAVESAQRLTGMAWSSGRATLVYLTGTVAPATVSLAHRGASSTIGLLSTRLHATPNLFYSRGRPTGTTTTTTTTARTSAHTSPLSHQETQCYEDQIDRVAADTRAGHSNKNSLDFDKRSRCELSLQDQQPSLTVPSSALISREKHHHRHRQQQCRATESMMTLSTINTASSGTLNTAQFSQSRHKDRRRRRRRFPLQTMSGPEHLDPEIRRQLEAEGLASLDLRDGTAVARHMRSWYDPRRYGLPKYILCHRVRTPRPCTAILISILVVCIILPLVARR